MNPYYYQIRLYLQAVNTVQRLGLPCAQTFDDDEEPRLFMPAMSPYCGAWYQIKDPDRKPFVFYDEEKQCYILEHVLLTGPTDTMRKLDPTTLVVNLATQMKHHENGLFNIFQPWVRFGLDSKYNVLADPPWRVSRWQPDCVRVALYNASSAVLEFLQDQHSSSFKTLLLVTSSKDLVEKFAWGYVAHCETSPELLNPPHTEVASGWLDFEARTGIFVQLWYEPEETRLGAVPVSRLVVEVVEDKDDEMTRRMRRKTLQLHPKNANV